MPEAYEMREGGYFSAYSNDTLKMYMPNRMFLFVCLILQGVLHERT